MISACIFLVAWLATKTESQIQNCPLDWHDYGGHCYKFAIYPPQTYEAAVEGCRSLGAALVSVNTAAENAFIVQWLNQNSITRDNWYTSGEKSIASSNEFTWMGDGTQAQMGSTWFGELTGVGNLLVYHDAGFGYVWIRSTGMQSLPYVCEIPKSEMYRLYQQNRDFEYGLGTSDPAILNRGPSFTLQPTDLEIAGTNNNTFSYVWIECVAYGYPQPTYEWYKIDTSGTLEITSIVDRRYTITNGRLSIVRPDSSRDAGDYYCMAENQFGSLRSDPMAIVFNSLDDFTNVISEDVTANAFQFAVIDCDIDRTDVSFAWAKRTPSNLIIPERGFEYIFISKNGKLYFSQVTKDDEGIYYCIVSLNIGIGVNSQQSWYQNALRIPSKISLPIGLHVLEDAASEWGPEITDDFIYLTPEPPLRGSTILLECFAVGTPPITYSWARDDGHIPARAKLSDGNRLLAISNVQLEDSGVYRCTAMRTTSARADKAFTLMIQAQPFFVFPLKNQHMDIGAQLTWRCYAKAIPDPTYSWFKNGEPLIPIPGKLEINRNVIVIHQLDAFEDDGMYQCGATNLHGTSYSNAQLRVLSIKPTFQKSREEEIFNGAIGGSIVLPCQPEAAPTPTIEWSFRGSSLGLNQGSRYQQMGTGDLQIMELDQSDEGEYTCTATNDGGQDFLTVIVQLSSSIVISRRPSSQTVVANETAFFYCSPSSNPMYEVVHHWRFNGHQLDIENDPHYVLGGGLYVRNVRRKHDGIYECVIISVVDEASAGAKLTVIGPPGPPLGLYVLEISIGAYSMDIKWTPGANGGRRISSYDIQKMTSFNEVWETIISSVPQSNIYLDDEDEKYSYSIDLLKPGNSYRFRLAASNDLGQGVYSSPTKYYTTNMAPPAVPPSGVGGGGGSEGLLTLNWDEMSKEDLNGDDLGYVVYWKPVGPRLEWNKNKLYGAGTTQHVEVVGISQYYLPYEVKVQAFNSLGYGPNSSVETVFSAEGLPPAQPSGISVDPINATALIVMWTPVEDTREQMHGVILGYQITYWQKDDPDPIYWSETYPGQHSEGVIIGLEIDTWYLAFVQVYNTAGLGPPSQGDEDSTNGLQPIQYPTEVTVHSYSSDTVYVTFRGVTPSIYEDPYYGYKLKFWSLGEHIRDAREVDLYRHNYGYIAGIKKDVVYVLRALAYSAGGDGVGSETVMFTLAGSQILYDDRATDLLAGASEHSVSLQMVMWCTFAVLLTTRIFHAEYQ